MRRKKKIVVLGILVLTLCIFGWFDIDSHARKNGLLEVLSQKGTVVLSPSVTEALLRDLNSGDPARVKRWHSYIYKSAGFDSDRATQIPPLQDALALYISKEKPGRSNHFNNLVFALRHEASSLSRNDLLGYLGSPDFISDGLNEQTLQYGYRYDGMDWVASVVVSNDVVVRIGIYVK